MLNTRGNTWEQLGILGAIVFMKPKTILVAKEGPAN